MCARQQAPKPAFRNNYRLFALAIAMQLLSLFATGSAAPTKLLPKPAHTGCEALLLDAENETTQFADFWQQTGPVYILADDSAAQGVKQGIPLTFSFDSEIAYADSFRLIVRNEKHLSQLKAIFESVHLMRIKPVDESGTPLEQQVDIFLQRLDHLQKRILGMPVSLNNLPVELLAFALQITPKQLRHFHLRKGSDRQRDAYALTDLSPRAFDRLMNILARSLVGFGDTRLDDLPEPFYLYYSSARGLIEEYRKIVEQILVREQNLPIEVTRDCNYVELVHCLYETVPAELQRLLYQDIAGQFEFASTHLHLGIPASMDDTAVLAIARATEARIVLEHASQPVKRQSDLYATSYTSFQSFHQQSQVNSMRQAGMIRLNLNRFEKPQLMHDLEIRNYTSLEEGLHHLAFAAVLARNSSRLAFVEYNPGDGLVDPKVGHIEESLRYVGQVLSESSDSSAIEAATTLLALAEEVNSAQEVTEKLRKKLAKTLQHINIMRYMTPTYFLR